MRVGFKVTDHRRGVAGCSIHYWPAVYRAAEKIDLTVNLGLPAPQFTPSLSRRGHNTRAISATFGARRFRWAGNFDTE